MKLEQIIDGLGLRVYYAGEAKGADVNGAYVSDLLSDVMGGAEEGQLWITLQAHGNVIAIASLRELAGILLVNGIEPEESILARAREEEIPVLGTEQSTYEITGKLYQLLTS